MACTAEQGLDTILMEVRVHAQAGSGFQDTDSRQGMAGKLAA